MHFDRFGIFLILFGTGIFYVFLNFIFNWNFIIFFVELLQGIALFFGFLFLLVGLMLVFQK